MAVLQINIDDTLKEQADTLFSSLGLDTQSSVHIFLNASIENKSIPFPVQDKIISSSLQEAIYDSRFRQNLNGPFANAKEAVVSMFED